MSHEAGQRPSATRTIFDRDILHPTNPVLPGSDPVLTIRGSVAANPNLLNVEGITYRDGIVHCACFGSARYTAVNVQDPDNPFIVGSYAGPTNAGGLSGTTEIVLTEDGVPILAAYGVGNVTSINNTDPANPTLLNTIYGTQFGGTYSTSMLHVRGIIRVGNFAFVTSDQAKLFAINISDPAHLGVASVISTSTSTSTGALAWAWHIARNDEGTIAYITTQNSDGSPGARCTCVDISNPYNMQILGSRSVTPNQGGWGMSYRGGYCYVGGGQRLVIMDVNDPTNPTQVGGSPVGGTTIFGTTPLQGRYVLVCEPFTDALRCYKVSDPTVPVTGWAGSAVSHATLLNGARDVVVNPNGQFAYVAAYDGSRITVVGIT